LSADRFVGELVRAIGRERVLTAVEDLACYAYDATPAAPRIYPAAVVFPACTDEVAAVIRAAAAHRTPVVARGAGTSLSGGALPVDGAVVLSLAGMDAILDLDAENMVAVVQPGLVVADLVAAAERVGLLYPPDPASLAMATMGGSVAECAGGLRGLKYGVTRDYVIGLEVVLADGSVARFGGRTVKNVSGYDMIRLFVGSEGTLGVVTEITVRLVPLPPARRTLLVSFEALAAAGRAVAGIIAGKVVPATMELMDRVAIEVVESFTHAGLPLSAAAILLIELDGLPEVVAHEAIVVEQVCRAEGGAVRVAVDDEERDRLWAARRGAFGALARHSPTTIVEDATVPRSRVPDMIAALQQIARRHGITIATMGHAGDGNLHPTILTDERDADEMRRVHAAVDEVFAAAVSLGGTLSGEHGIGTEKKPYLTREFGAASMAAMRAVKRALDPQGILNPGKLIDVQTAAGQTGAESRE